MNPNGSVPETEVGNDPNAAAGIDSIVINTVAELFCGGAGGTRATRATRAGTGTVGGGGC